MGGSGFIGKALAKSFYHKGWNVSIISRSSKLINDLPFAKIIKWDEK